MEERSAIAERLFVCRLRAIIYRMNILPQLFLNGLIAGSIYALMALGFNLIYRTTKFFNLAHGAMAVIGGYAVFYLAKQLGWNIVLSSALGVLVTGCAGYLLYGFIFSPMIKRKASNMVLLVASLGVFTAIQALIAIFFTSQFQSLDLSNGVQRTYALLGGIVTLPQLIIFASVVVVSLALALLLRLTLFGKAVKAISDDEEVAKIVGIHTEKIAGWVFFIGSAIAGLAGILCGFDIGIEPTRGLSLLLKGVIAVIIGGAGNLWGGIIGALLLGLAENFGIWKISGEWQDVIAFSVLLLVLLVRPQGIFKQ